MLSRKLVLMMLIMLLLACSRHTPTIREIGEFSRADFMSALRWKRYPLAAELMLPEFRTPFLQRFNDLRDDIHITDVRLIDMQSSESDRRFDTTIELDYYLLPSVTVKTFTFEQTWQYRPGPDGSRQGFYIVTPFPEFP